MSTEFDKVADDFPEDDEVQILHVFELGPAEPESPKEVHHAPSRPLPYRVRGGCFEDEHLVLGNERILWDDIEFLCLGIIEQMVKDSEAPKGMVRKVMGKVLFSKEDDKAKDKGKQTTDVYVLDLFVKGQERAYRMDAANLNYSTFLDDIGYISLHNFYKFVVNLCRRAVKARVNSSLAAFVARDRHHIARYPAIYEFEMNTNNVLAGTEDSIGCTDLDLSRDNWVDDWDAW